MRKLQIPHIHENLAKIFQDFKDEGRANFTNGDVAEEYIKRFGEDQKLVAKAPLNEYVPGNIPHYINNGRRPTNGPVIQIDEDGGYSFVD